jgi:hypothetical protein
MWKPTDTYLAHSRGPWKRHKYIAVKNGRYIYNTHSGVSLTDGSKKKNAADPDAAARSAGEANAKGRNRTLNEQKKAYEAHKDRFHRAVTTATREQAKGKARTEREKRRLEEGYYKERSSKNYGDRLNAKRKELLRSYGSKSMDAARRVDKQMKIADRIYSKGKMREYEKAHGYDKAKTKGKNPTYKKNQRRAKLESLIFQGKRKVKKLLNSLTTRKPKKYTIKGVNFVEDKSRKPTPVRKASKSAGETIYKAYQDQKKKKRR